MKATKGRRPVVEVERDLINEAFTSHFAGRMRKLMDRGGWTIKDLCQAIEEPAPKVASWLQGKSIPTLPGEWRDLCESLNTTMDYLLFGIGDPVTGMEGERATRGRAINLNGLNLIN